MVQGHPDIAEILIKFGGRGSSLKDLKQIQLIEASVNHDIEKMGEAIRDGADINFDDKYGRSALVEALRINFYRKSEYESVIYLLNNGADPNHISKTDWGNFSPLGMAVMSSTVWLKKRDKIREDFKDSPKYARLTLEQLIKHGAYVSGIDEDGRTPLHIAAEENNLIAAEILIKHGAKIQDQDNHGKSPYYYAKSEEMIKLLKSQSFKWQFYFVMGLFSIVACLVVIILILFKKK